MSDDVGTSIWRRRWSRVYAAFLVLLPRDLRDKHGESMQELFDREVERSVSAGLLSVSAGMFSGSTTAMAGIADLVQRGIRERAGIERRAWGHGDVLLLRQTGAGFVFGFLVLTVFFVFQAVRSKLELFSDDRLSIVLYAIPFTAAMTIPMALFIAVLFAARGRTPSSELSVRVTPTRLTPLIGLATVIAVLLFGMNAEIVPRANARLEAIYAGTTDVPRSNRSLTLTELRANSRPLPVEAGVISASTSRERLVGYQVETHKKLVLPVACVLLTLMAVGIARRAPHAGLFLQVVASVIVFYGYYAVLSVGESLAKNMVFTPWLAMCSANILVLFIATTTLWTGGGRDASDAVLTG